jgi:hypothetical protein
VPRAQARRQQPQMAICPYCNQKAWGGLSCCLSCGGLVARLGPLADALLLFGVGVLAWWGEGACWVAQATPGQQPIRIRSDYVPRAQARRQQPQMAICPYCNHC